MVCKYCGLDRPENEFENANIIDGKIYKRKKCNRCKMDTQNQRRWKTSEWLKEYKKTLKCSRCEVSDYRVLEFHHLYGKDNEVSNMLTLSIKRILEEIEKCEVLCANCHRIEHYDKRGVG